MQLLYSLVYQLVCNIEPHILFLTPCLMDKATWSTMFLTPPRRCHPQLETMLESVFASCHQWSNRLLSCLVRVPFSNFYHSIRSSWKNLVTGCRSRSNLTLFKISLRTGSFHHFAECPSVIIFYHHFSHFIMNFIQSWFPLGLRVFKVHQTTICMHNTL